MSTAVVKGLCQQRDSVKLDSLQLTTCHPHDQTTALPSFDILPLAPSQQSHHADDKPKSGLIPIPDAKLDQARKLYKDFLMQEALASVSNINDMAKGFLEQEALSSVSSVTDVTDEILPSGPLGDTNTQTRQQHRVYNGDRVSQRHRKRFSPINRARTALIRLLGACPSCRKRTVRCSLSHHNLNFDKLEVTLSIDSAAAIDDRRPASNLACKPLEFKCWHAALGFSCPGKIGRSPQVRRLLDDHSYSKKSKNSHRLPPKCQRCGRLWRNNEAAEQHNTELKSNAPCEVLSPEYLEVANADLNAKGISSERKDEIDKAIAQFKKDKGIPVGCDRDEFNTWIARNRPIHIGRSDLPQVKAEQELGQWFVVWYTLFPGKEIPCHPFIDARLDPKKRNQILDLSMSGIAEDSEKGRLPRLDQEHLDIIRGHFWHGIEVQYDGLLQERNATQRAKRTRGGNLSDSRTVDPTPKRRKLSPISNSSSTMTPIMDSFSQPSLFQSLMINSAPSQPDPFPPDYSNSAMASFTGSMGHHPFSASGSQTLTSSALSPRFYFQDSDVSELNETMIVASASQLHTTVPCGEPNSTPVQGTMFDLFNTPQEDNEWLEGMQFQWNGHM